MAAMLNAYLSFDGDAREAMERYAEVLGGELTVHTFGDYGEQDPAIKDGVMHATLTSAAMTLMASDMPPGTQLQRGNDCTLSLSGTDADELRGYWAGLIEGGAVTMPLEQQMWGDEFGMCTDRFGVGWMVNISPEGSPG